MRKTFLVLLMCIIGASVCSCGYTENEKVTIEKTAVTIKMPQKVAGVNIVGHIEESSPVPVSDEDTWRFECDGKEVTMKRLVEPMPLLVTDKTKIYELPSEVASYKEIQEKVVYAYAYTDNGYWVVPEIRGFIQQNQ